VLLRREGHPEKVKRVYRLYRDAGLLLRLTRPKRDKAAKLRQPKQLAHAINEIWGMDFVADNLFDRRKLRMLTVVARYTRECLAIDLEQSLKGEDVVRPERHRRPPRPTADQQDRQRQRVHLQGNRQVGLRARRRDELQPAWQAEQKLLLPNGIESGEGSIAPPVPHGSRSGCEPAETICAASCGAKFLG